MICVTWGWPHTWCAPLTTDPWSLSQDGLGLLDRPHPGPLPLAAPVAESGTRADGEVPWPQSGPGPGGQHRQAVSHPRHQRGQHPVSQQWPQQRGRGQQSRESGLRAGHEGHLSPTQPGTSGPGLGAWGWSQTRPDEGSWPRSSASWSQEHASPCQNDRDWVVCQLGPARAERRGPRRGLGDGRAAPHAAPGPVRVRESRVARAGEGRHQGGQRGRDGRDGELVPGLQQRQLPHEQREQLQVRSSLSSSSLSSSLSSIIMITRLFQGQFPLGQGQQLRGPRDWRLVWPGGGEGGRARGDIWPGGPGGADSVLQSAHPAAPASTGTHQLLINDSW